MELNDLFSETAEVRADYKGRAFIMRAYTEKLTPEYKAQLILITAAADDTAEQNTKKDESCQMLADLVDSWTDGEGGNITVDGKVFPPTYENLMKLSYQLIATLIRAVTTFLGDLANPPKEIS